MTVLTTCSALHRCILWTALIVLNSFAHPTACYPAYTLYLETSGPSGLCATCVQNGSITLSSAAVASLVCSTVKDATPLTLKPSIQALPCPSTSTISIAVASAGSKGYRAGICSAITSPTALSDVSVTCSAYEQQTVIASATLYYPASLTAAIGPTTSGASPTGSLSPAIIVALSAGAFVFVLLISFALFFYIRMRRHLRLYATNSLNRSVASTKKFQSHEYGLRDLLGEGTDTLQPESTADRTLNRILPEKEGMSSTMDYSERSYQSTTTSPHPNKSYSPPSPAYLDNSANDDSGSAVAASPPSAMASNKNINKKKKSAAMIMDNDWKATKDDLEMKLGTLQQSGGRPEERPPPPPPGMTTTLSPQRRARNGTELQNRMVELGLRKVGADGNLISVQPTPQLTPGTAAARRITVIQSLRSDPDL